MVFENVAGGEGLAAGATCIGTLIGMGAFVLHTSRVVGEASSTILAGEWSLSSVLTHVTLQFRRGTEAFLTDSESNLIMRQSLKADRRLMRNLLALEILLAAMSTTV